MHRTRYAQLRVNKILLLPRIRAPLCGEHWTPLTDPTQQDRIGTGNSHVLWQVGRNAGEE
jgi:hypothetical protein